MWIAPVVSGVSATLSLIVVILVAKMKTQDDHERWLREERIRSVIQLKLAVSRVRSEYSRPHEVAQVDAGALHHDFDFTEVNAAMTHIDVVGTQSAVSEVATLRRGLREFVRASSNSGPEWRAKRNALDATVNNIVELVRKDVVL
ncbi:hypothetical protein [Streptomyces sp. yr375]|uniref:hypothetical protein n=1 Tax=Streptomyces sp. yr375 TaxID=1761906 RepID=UPI0011602BDA|nr:hypothetical protein [Streptomyces sp. yr375]